MSRWHEFWECLVTLQWVEIPSLAGNTILHVTVGACDQKTTEDTLDFYYEQGGNFIDTSNNYQLEESEKWIGEWMKKRGVPYQMVIATKYDQLPRRQG